MNPLVGCGLTVDLFPPGAVREITWDALLQGTPEWLTNKLERVRSYSHPHKVYEVSLTPLLLSIYDAPNAEEFHGSIYKENQGIGLENWDLTEEFLQLRNNGIGQVRVGAPIFETNGGEGEVFYVTRSYLHYSQQEGARTVGPRFASWWGKTESGYELKISGRPDSVSMATIEGQGREIKIQVVGEGTDTGFSWEIDRSAVIQQSEEERKALNAERKRAKAEPEHQQQREVAEPPDTTRLPGVPEPPPLPDQSMLPDPSTFSFKSPRPTWVECL